MNKKVAQAWIESALAENPNLPSISQTYKSFQKETGVYDYDGKCIRKISLSETEYVMNIYNVNDERDMVNIADWKSGKIRSIDI